MGRIAFRRAAGILSVCLASVGAAIAADRPPKPPGLDDAPPVILPRDAAERSAPPVAVPPPALIDGPPSQFAELAVPPPIAVGPPSLVPAADGPPLRLPTPAIPSPPKKGSRTPVLVGPPPISVSPPRSIAAVDAPPILAPKPREVAPKATIPESTAPPATLAPPVVDMLEEIPAPKSDKDGTSAAADCPDPWAKVPVVQVFPRMGMFLVPGSGPGYYSFQDVLQGNYREKAPNFPYPPFALQPPSGFDADYRYLDKPDNTQHDWADILKRVHVTPDTMVTLGGQADARYMSETNARLGRTTDSYTLYRARAWADVWYTDQFRVYGEFLTAQIRGNELPARPIDENRADILNLFAEMKITDIEGRPLSVRAGRQELLFGSQRLVSTLDWANTRRTFDGVRAFWRGEDIDADVFWSRPVTIKPSDSDTANKDVQFYGAWLTGRPVKGQSIDLYFLGLQDDAVVADRFLAGSNVPRGRAEYKTLGARYAGNQGNFLFDLEGMVQAGTDVNRDHSAYAYTAAVGWEFKECVCRPQVWVEYDYASGTADPAAGKSQTFNPLFPFGHYYFGFLDLVGRRNIQDLSVQLAAYPDNWITLVAQGHHFQLAESRDFLYNAASVPTRRSPTGVAGRDVGNEIDLLANFHVTAHQDILVGYSKLFAGDFIKQTGPNVSPDLFYFMYNLRW